MVGRRAFLRLLGLAPVGAPFVARAAIAAARAEPGLAGISLHGASLRGVSGLMVASDFRPIALETLNWPTFEDHEGWTPDCDPCSVLAARPSCRDRPTMGAAVQTAFIDDAGGGP